MLILAATEGAHELPMSAVELFRFGPLVVTNSMIPAWIVAIGLIIFAQVAMRSPRLVPKGAQNFLEWVIESLAGLLEGVLGQEWARKTLWFFTSIFLFILCSNWFGLFPGVGTIGRGHGENWYDMIITQPFIRGANADVNMTMAMALVFFVLWTVWSLQANGVGGFVHHIFGSKADNKGLIGIVMIGVFIFVGVIEVISIAFRPVSLSFRLFGNVYGGEYMLESMMAINKWLSWLIPLPFYFFELLVGLVQALVFCLLTAVFTGMMCRHEEGHH